jgi:galactonate dehydratase
MKITGVETLIPVDHPGLTWVQIHTDEGVVGLGETSNDARAVAEIVHNLLASLLLGRDPTQIELLWHQMFRATNYRGTGGAELRALSAVDIALWDLLGKATGQPVYRLLGGASREEVPVYNTCGSYGEIDDRRRFLEEPGDLARELLADGITAMKIWPFDGYAAAREGQYISAHQVSEGVERLAAIRDAVGHDMDVAIEGHTLWNLPSAIRIARALEAYEPMWLEDMIWAENIDALAELRRATSAPIIASERVMTRWGFRALIEARAADIVMFDPIWTGGLTESRRIAYLASSFELPVAPHNCGGPVAHVAACHLATHVYNLYVMESFRAFYRGYYADLVTYVPQPENGMIRLEANPGLGVELMPDVLEEGQVVRAMTTEVNEAVVGFARGDPWRTMRF